MDDLDRWTRVLSLGAGAFGEVHLAWDRQDGRWVALKRFTGQDELGLLRMVIESRIRVSHPHLVHTVAFHLVDDRAWLVTELARGGSLRALMTRTGTLPWGWVAEAVDQVLAALTALHATGVVHRDLKPANLLLRSVGTAPPHLLVGDFGIATWRTVSMTGIGAAIGTPGYLAPEYLDGHQPSPATDVFAVGVLAAELLTGQRLVHYSNASPTMPSTWHEVLPVPPDVPRGLAAVLQRMAAPDPNHRYRDCTQAREALQTAVPREARTALPAVQVPDLLAGLPPGWTTEGPAQPTTALATPATALPTPAADANPHAETNPTAEASSAAAANPQPRTDQANVIQPSRPTPEPNPDLPPDPPSPDRATSPANLVALPIDGGPTALVLENKTALNPGPAAATTPATPSPTSGSSNSPLTGSATPPTPTGSATHPPTGSATSPAAPPTGPSTHPPTGSATPPTAAPASGSASSPLSGSATPHASPRTGSSTHPPTSPPTPPRGSATSTDARREAKAKAKARRRKKTKQAFLLIVLIFFASGAGTLWWAANHRAIPGNPSATGGTTDQPAGTSRWEPTIVEGCALVEVDSTRRGQNGTERCQRTPNLDPPQHWVEAPPAGFPKSNAGGPFPNESCTADGDRDYSPVGDHVECANGTWRVIA